MSRSLALLWGGVVLVLLAVSRWAAAFEGALWPCLFKSWTGIACPTCGVTRAAVALAELDVLGALRRYPLPTIAWIAFIAFGLAAFALTLSGRTPPALPSRLSVGARVALAAALLLNWGYSIATGV